MLLRKQVQVIDALDHAKLSVRSKDRDRGEVTATTALIVLLVAGALVAGGLIADAMLNNAEAIPSP